MVHKCDIKQVDPSATRRAYAVHRPMQTGRYGFHNGMQSSLGKVRSQYRHLPIVPRDSFPSMHAGHQVVTKRVGCFGAVVFTARFGHRGEWCLTILLQSNGKHTLCDVHVEARARIGRGYWILNSALQFFTVKYRTQYESPVLREIDKQPDVGRPCHVGISILDPPVYL